MKTLVVGASGATGKHLVQQLLDMRHEVKAIVRSPENLPKAWKNHKELSIIKANISEISETEMADYVRDCHAVGCCLGHNLTLKGIYGRPRKLVTDAVSLICHAIKKNSPHTPVKFALMNTAGNRNINEMISFGQRLVIELVRFLLPPHTDNEKAADYLRVNISQEDPEIQWVVVRPDALINDENVTPYSLHASPTRSAIFNPGKSSRINVGHFMAAILTKNDLWIQWKGKMPVIYNDDI